MSDTEFLLFLMNRLCTVLILFSFIIFSILYPRRLLAVTLTISNLPASLDISSESEVDLFFECSGCGDSFVRGVFFPGGTNYFGFTQNNSGEWIDTSNDRSQYFKISKTDLIDASWSGRIKVKPNSGDSAYNGPGEYLFKVGRYTSANDSGADWSNELAIRILGPTPTPTPTTAPTITPTPTAHPTTPTATPTAKPVITKSPSPHPTPTIILIENKDESTPTPSPKVLGVVDKTNSPVFLGKSTENVDTSQSVLGFLFLGIGIVLIIFSVLLTLKPSFFRRVG